MELRNFFGYINRKPLLAVYLVVIIMYVSTGEAAPRPENKRRHNRKLALDNNLNKEITLNNHNHNRKLTLDNNHNRALALDIKHYKEAIETITKGLNHIENTLKTSRQRLNATRDFSFGNPKWLPKVNYVDIHKNNTGGWKSRFRHLIPRLHTHLMEYYHIFDLLLKMNINGGAAASETLKERDEVLQNDKILLSSVITLIEDKVQSVNMAPLKFDATRVTAEGFSLNVQEVKWQTQDRIFYRGYSNIIKNYHLELACPTRRPSSRRPGSKRSRPLKNKCLKYEILLNRREMTKIERHRM